MAFFVNKNTVIRRVFCAGWTRTSLLRKSILEHFGILMGSSGSTESRNNGPETVTRPGTGELQFRDHYSSPKIKFRSVVPVGRRWKPRILGPANIYTNVHNNFVEPNFQVSTQINSNGVSNNIRPKIPISNSSTRPKKLANESIPLVYKIIYL